MRGSEIKVGLSYAVVGKGIARAHVRVVDIRRIERRGQPYFECEVVEGLVYTGWSKNQDGHLDTEYVGPPERVLLVSRDFVRPWLDELERRIERDGQRSQISEVLSEMDEVLNALGLSSSYMQLVQTANGPIAVTVLGIEELNTIRDKIEENHD